MTKLYCVECAVEVTPRLTNGEEIYPHRSDLWDLPFWVCDECHNYVGCHNKTAEPTKALGVIPNEEIRKVRKQVHAILDPLWRNKIMKRGKIYQIMSYKLGYTYHSGELRTVEEARRALKAALEIKGN